MADPVIIILILAAFAVGIVFGAGIVYWAGSTQRRPAPEPFDAPEHIGLI